MYTVGPLLLLRAESEIVRPTLQVMVPSHKIQGSSGISEMRHSSSLLHVALSLELHNERSDLRNEGEARCIIIVRTKAGGE